MVAIGRFLRTVAGEVGRALVRFSDGGKSSGVRRDGNEGSMAMLAPVRFVDGDGCEDSASGSSAGKCPRRPGAGVRKSRGNGRGRGEETMKKDGKGVGDRKCRKEGKRTLTKKGEVSSTIAPRPYVRWKPRPVVCTDADGDEMRFGSIREASEATMVSTTSIIAVCSGQKGRVTAGGWRWRFEDPADVVKQPVERPTASDAAVGRFRNVRITAEDEARFQRAKDICEHGIDWVCGDHRKHKRFVSSLRTAGDVGFAGSGEDEMTEERKSELLKRYGMGTKRVRDRVTRRRVANGGGWGGDGKQDAFRGCPIVGKYPRVTSGDLVREGEDRAEGVRDGV